MKTKTRVADPNPVANYEPLAKLIAAGKAQMAKSWTFEKLEDRQMMAVDVSFNDPYFGFQWNLLNTGSIDIGDRQIQNTFGVAGEDINVVPAWSPNLLYEVTGQHELKDIGLSGDGVRVAIVSSGVQTTHPDLAANISTEFGFDALAGQFGADFSSQQGAGGLEPFFSTDPFAGPDPQLEADGTALAGIVGAVANNGTGIVGVAHGSELVPVRLTTFDNGGSLGLTGPGSGLSLPGTGIALPDGTPIDITYTPERLESLFRWENDDVDIYLHGWGPDDIVRNIFDVSEREILALQDSVDFGRGGLGNIHIFQSGDGATAGFGAEPNPAFLGTSDFAGYNGYVNSRYTIGVTAVDHDGQVANEDGTVTAYPEIAPSVLVAAPSGSFNNFGIVDSPTVGTGIWTTDFAPVRGITNPDFEFEEGFNAPTVFVTPGDEFGPEPDDLLLNPVTGLTLTDRFFDADYTSRYSGTGAAAAQVAGVVALMLEADRLANGGQETLSYRDVQEILVRSSRQNAPFENLNNGFENGLDPPFENPETWITNRNEVFHDPDFFDGLFTTHIFNPIIDPSLNILTFLDPTEGDFGLFTDPDWSNVSLFTNGAGYTVSQGRTFQGAEVGYGHGVVDAELAVKLAAQWNTLDQNLAPEETYTSARVPPADGLIPGFSISNQDSGFLLIPGRLGADTDIATLYNEFGADDPFADYDGPTDVGFVLEVAVPEDRNLAVEWVEVDLGLSTADISQLRITLISPTGVHSELNNYFDEVTGSTHQKQHSADIVNLGGAPETLAGTPGGPGDVDGGAVIYNFTSNRHWGERADPQVLYDPATGEPYDASFLGAANEPGSVVLPQATTGTWQVMFENYGPDAITLTEFEIAFHGTPIVEDTLRIAGFVGVDENRDGAFNFDRYIQEYNDALVVTSGNEANFNRLGAVERFADETQEQFAENAIVELYSRTQSQIDLLNNGVDDGQADIDAERGVLIDRFLTGDDGNYYFDVVPPTPVADTPNDDEFNIDLVFTDPVSDTVRAAFENAVADWESVITGDLPNVVTPDGVVIDDIVISASIDIIDGPETLVMEPSEADETVIIEFITGGIQAQGTPLAVRGGEFGVDGAGLPTIGGLTLDIDDIQTMINENTLEDVIRREIGAILGIGTLWDAFGLVSDIGTADVRYTGEQGTQAWLDLAGLDPTIDDFVFRDDNNDGVFDPADDTVGLPIETTVSFIEETVNTPPQIAVFGNFVGPIVGDTLLQHWSEAVFANELMTGQLADPPAGALPPFDPPINPLSVISVASLADLGYTVDLTAAEDYTPPPFPPAGFPPGAGGPGAGAGGGGAAAAALTSAESPEGPTQPGATPSAEPMFAGAASPFVLDASLTQLGGGGSNVVDPIVEYIVRVADNEGRGPALNDLPDLDEFGANFNPATSRQSFIELNPDGTVATVTNNNGTPGDPSDDFQEPERVSLQKYRNEWTLTSDWFRAWDREGRAPDFVRDNAGIVTGGVIGDTIFNPAFDYDIVVDDMGTPNDPNDDVPVSFIGNGGTIADNVYGINFLLTPPDEQVQVSQTEVTLSGRVFDDRDETGHFGNEDAGVGGVRVYIDTNFNGAYEQGEPFVFTNDGSTDISQLGTYQFSFFDIDVDGDGELDELPPDLLSVQIGVDQQTVFGFDFGKPESGVRIAFLEPGQLPETGFDFALVEEAAGGGPSDNPPDFGPPPSDTPGRVGGLVFSDANENGSRDSTEGGVAANIRVYVDANANGSFDSEELSTLTNSFGAFSLSNIPPGNIDLRIDLTDQVDTSGNIRFFQTEPEANGAVFLEVSPGANIQNVLFGVRDLADRDFGDLAFFPTLEADFGAWHAIKPGLRLGSSIDGELDGQPNVLATGDDLDALLNDDDGVLLIETETPGVITPGEVINFEFNVVGVGQSLNGWIDFNGNNLFEPSEHVFVDALVQNGLNVTGTGNPALPTITAPANTTTTGPIAARFRLGGAGLDFFGPADSGEVEDYLYNVWAVSSALLTPGDYDRDGQVNTADYAVWKSQFNQVGAGLNADGNGDGRVDMADFTLWRDNLNQTLPILGPIGFTPPGGGAGAGSFSTPLAAFDLASALASVGLATETMPNGDVSVIAPQGIVSSEAAAMLEAVGASTLDDNNLLLALDYAVAGPVQPDPIEIDTLGEQEEDDEPDTATLAEVFATL
ncbi:MAG: S8 family serine peptidase [Planctomycetota bacterium]